MANVSIPLVALLLFGSACAEDCSTYRYSSGEICYKYIRGNLNILSTGSAELVFDDADEELEALDEAKLNATAGIAKAISEIDNDINMSLYRRSEQWICMNPTKQSDVGNEHIDSVMSGITVMDKCLGTDEIRVTVRYSKIIHGDD